VAVENGRDEVKARHIAGHHRNGVALWLEEQLLHKKKKRDSMEPLSKCIKTNFSFLFQ
jgi:hypothetical protein